MRQILLRNAITLLLQNAAKMYFKIFQISYYKKRQFYYKLRQLLQNVSRYYYKMRQSLQNATLLQNALVQKILICYAIKP